MLQVNENAKVALILGATGGIGGEVARRLKARGWRVRALSRSAEKAAAKFADIDWISGDAMVADDVVSAAFGADVIVHAVNPAGYANWGKLVLPMIDNTIAAAKEVGATIVLPGTVYNFGPDAFPVLSETSPQNPVTVKGAIRVAMEARLKAAAEEGVRTIVVRAGDFFGPNAASTWFAQAMVKPGQPLASISYPGRAGIGHQWAYLPDVAETMIRLVEKGDALPAFAVYHMQGFWDDDGTQMVAAIRRAAGKPDLALAAFPWWLMHVAWPFVTFLRELREMRYLWSQSLRMTNDRLVAVLGEEPRTPIDSAVRTTLFGLGCMPNKCAGWPSVSTALHAPSA